MNDLSDKVIMSIESPPNESVGEFFRTWMEEVKIHRRKMSRHMSGRAVDMRLSDEFLKPIFMQVRFPRSKRRRIRIKWAKRPANCVRLRQFNICRDMGVNLGDKTTFRFIGRVVPGAELALP